MVASDTPNTSANGDTQAPAPVDIAIPPKGSSVSVPVMPGVEYKIEASKADFAQDGTNLVVKTPDGGDVVLQDYFLFSQGDLPPQIALNDGKDIGPDRIMANIENPDLNAIETAAGGTGGGGGGATGGGAAFSPYGPGDIGTGLNTLDLLGNLDMSFYRPNVDAGGALDPDFALGTVSGEGGVANFGTMVSEDLRPTQNLYGNGAAVVPGHLNIVFTPHDNEYVVRTTISGFPDGMALELTNGATVDLKAANSDTSESISFAGGSATYTPSPSGGSWSITIDGGLERDVKIVGLPQDSDKDINLTANVDIRDPDSGHTATLTANGTVVIDAVADRPEDITGAVSDSGSDQHAMTESKEHTDSFSDGYDHTTDTVKAGPDEGSVTATFKVTVTFGDYKDGSESHFVLVEKLPGFDGNYDIERHTDEHGVTTEYFKVPVDNQEIIDAGRGGEITIDVTLKTPSISGDTTYDLKTGAMAVEKPSDQEFNPDNNVAYNFSNNTTQLTVDVINSKLAIDIGWASEGDSPDKNLASGQHAKDYGGESIAAASTTATGEAPITLKLSGEVNSHETIQSVSFTFDESRGTLEYSGNPSNFSSTQNPDGTITYTIANVNSDTLNDLVFKPATSGDQSYNSNDVHLDYKVTVTNGEGASATFSGSSTIVIDAVADRSTDVSSNIDGSATVVDHDPQATITVDKTDAAGPNQGTGWETDTFTNNYAPTNYALTVNVSTTFPDLDGSEKHYILVEQPTGWTLDAGHLPAGYSDAGTYTGSDGKTYFKIEVDESVQHGTVNVDIPLKTDAVTGDMSAVTIKTGSLSVEQRDSSTTAEHEYDKGNNSAERLDGTGVSYSVDVINSTLTVKTGWASEGDNDAKHLGLASGGYEYTGSQAGSTSQNATTHVNNGAPIQLSIAGGIGSTEVISEVTFTFDASRGTLDYTGPGAVTSSTTAGVTTYTITGVNSADIGNDLVFKPVTSGDQSYNSNDVHLDYKVTVTNGAGASATFNGSSTVAIDAVADRSTDVSAKIDGSDTVVIHDPHTTVSAGGTDAAGPNQATGWETDTFTNNYAPTNYSLTVNVSTTFADLDGSEKHYILVERPAGWTLDASHLPAGYSDAGTYTGSDGKTYFKIEVTDPAQGSVNVDIPLKTDAVTGDMSSVTIKTGSLAVEQTPSNAVSNREYDQGNNSAERLDGTAVKYGIDVINSTLTVKTGWASEGNNDAKHLGLASSGYEYTGSQAGSTSQNAATHVNNGAPIQLSIAGGVGSTEVISSVTFTFDASRGTLDYTGPGTVTSSTTAGVTTYTITGVNSADIGNNLVFKPVTSGDQSYNSNDVHLDYKVTVTNGAGASATFNGSSTVAIDAVADRSSAVASNIDGSANVVDHNPQGTVSAGGTDAAGPNQATGWETDTFKNVYDAKYSLSVNVSTTFADLDGSEKHYILVEQPAGWSLGTLPAGYSDAGTYTGSDGKTYFKIEVANPAQGTVNVSIPLQTGAVTGDMSSVTIKTGSLAVEQTPSNAVSNREYDQGNNSAERLDGTAVKYGIDVINSTLTVKTGWGSEGNNDAKHLGLASGGYEYTGSQKDSTSQNATTHVNNGAPIQLSIAGGIGSTEVISSVTFTFDASRGTLDYTGPGTVTSSTTAGVTTYTITGVNSTDIGNNLVFKPVTSGDQSYNSNDVHLDYKVTVTNGAGASATFNGSSTVAIDAVADRSSAVASNIDGSANVVIHDPHTTVTAGGTDAAAPNSSTGWETDTFKNTYAPANYSLNVKVSTNFADLDGSEKHYILVEQPAGWSLGTLPTGYSDAGTYTGSDGKTYFKIEVTDPAQGSVNVDIPLKTGTVTGDMSSVTIKTGSLAVEQTPSNAVSNREYDQGNNSAERLDGTAVKYGIDVINSTLTVKTGWASEGNNDAKHLGLTSGNYAYAGTQAGSTSENATTHVNNGAPIQLSIAGGVGSTEVISSVTFTFDASRGTLDYTGPGTVTSSTTAGVTTYTITGVNSTDIGNNLVFKPAATGPESFDNKDVHLDYKVTVTNGAGASATFNGSSTVAIDAVADQATVTVANNGSQVDYHTNLVGSVQVEQTAAKPGEHVTLHSTVTFPDTVGGETHYVLVETGAQDGFTVHGVTVGGITYSASDLAGLTQVTKDGVTCYQIPVSGSVGSFNVDVEVSSAYTSGDKTYNVSIGGKATVVGSGIEYDSGNNEAYKLQPVDFKVAPAQAGVSITTVGTYEGGNINQHGGTLTPIANAGAVNIKLTGTVDNEYMGRVYLKYDSSEGSLVCKGVTVPSGTMLSFDAQGNCLTSGFTTLKAADLGNNNLKYMPNSNSDSDKDVKIEFAASVIDPDSGDATVTTNISGWSNSSSIGGNLLSGVNDSTIAVKAPTTNSSTVTVDAVADKPVVNLDPDMNKVVDYQPQKDANGNIIRDNQGNPIEQSAARPGENVKVNIESVKFGDYKDGSESHFITVNQNLTSTTAGQPNATTSIAKGQTITLTGQDANGGTVTQTITFGADAASSRIHVEGQSGAVIDRAMTQAEYTAMTNGDGYGNFKIPVLNEFLQLTADGTVSTSVDIVAPSSGVNTSYSVNVGGDAKETPSDSGELTTANNESVTTKPVTIDVNPVTSTPKIVIDLADSKIYENNTPKANVPGNTDQGVGANIKISGIDKGETATIDLTFSLKNGQPLAGSVDPNDVMRIEYNGQEYDATLGSDGKWHVTVDVKGQDNGDAADGVLTFKPGSNYNSSDIHVDYDITVRDDNSGQVGKLVDDGHGGKVVVGNDANPWQNHDSNGGNGYQAENKDMGIVVDAVAQAPEFGEKGVTPDYAATGASAESIAKGEGAFVSGKNVALRADITFEDYKDGSEKHYMLVEAKVGWEAPTSIKIIDANGVAHDVPLSVTKQMYTDPVTGAKTMYYRLEVSNDMIDQYGKDGTIDAQIWMKSPSGAGDTSFKVGAIANEDASQFNNTNNVDFDKSNNTSIVIKDTPVHIHFDNATGAKLSIGNTYEDLNSQQNTTAGQTHKDKPGSIVFTSNTSGGDDEVLTKVTIDFKNPEGTVTLPGGIAIDSAGHITAPAGYHVNTDASGKTTITKDGVDSSIEITKDSGGTTHVTVTPGADAGLNTRLEVNYTPNANSDADFAFNYKTETKDPSSGDTASTSGSSRVVVDAVADQPKDLNIRGGEDDDHSGKQTFEMDHKVKIPNGSNPEYQSIKVTVDANFGSDIKDGSEAHYILIEVTANTYVADASGKPISCDIFYGPGGVRYYKVPVDNSEIKDDGTVSKDINLITYSRQLGVAEESTVTIRTGALAVEEHTSGGELSQNNNTAFLAGASFDIVNKWPGGHTIWIDPAFENNTPYANQDDSSKPGLQPDESAPKGSEFNGKMYFGTVQEHGPAITEADLSWNKDAGKIEIRDASGHVTKTYDNGSAQLTGDELKNAYFVPNHNYSDADVNMNYKLSDGSHSVSGTFPIIVDAVAQLPSAVDYDPTHDGGVYGDWQTKVDYGNDGHGNDYKAMGAPGNGGNEGTATITVGGGSPDEDGSELRYALLEDTGDFTIISPATAGTIYLYETTQDDSGRTWIKIPIPAGQTSVDIQIKLNNPTNGEHIIKTGIMTEEQNAGKPGNYEVDAKNNISYVLNGTTIIDVSTVDSSVSVSIPTATDENGTIHLNIGGTLGENDVFNGFSLTHSGNGAITLTDAGGNPISANGWSYDGHTLKITDFGVLEQIKSGAIKVDFTPEKYNDADVSWSWNSSFTDKLSGDTTGPSGSASTIVDAVAQAPDVADTGFGPADGLHEAATRAGEAVIKSTVTFKDLDGSESHYIVLEQDGDWNCTGVTVNGHFYAASQLTTMFSENGTPYYALKVTNGMLTNGSADVEFHLNAPDKSSDVADTLKVGGISVEETTGVSGAGGKETDLTNNWAEGLKDVSVGMAVVETTNVNLGVTGALTEDDATGVALSLNGVKVQDVNGDHVNDEIITQTTFTVGQAGASNGAVIGKIIYDGHEYEVKAGVSTTINFGANGFDSSKGPSFVLDANNHNNGDVTIKTDSTVVDTKSGDTKTFTDTDTINVVATADAPTNIEVTDPTYAAGTSAVGAGVNVSFTVSANFADTDGSEQHFILVEQKTGWGNPQSYGTVTEGGVTYFKIPVSSTASNPTVTITLKTPTNATDSAIDLKVGGMAVENSNNNTKFAFEGDDVTVKIGVVDTTAVTGSGHGVEDGAAAISLNVNGNNDSISKVVFDAPASGQIWYNGQAVSVVGGKVTIDNFDAAKGLEYHPAANWSGDVSLSYTATVKDNASGLTKTFTGSLPVSVDAVATEATGLAATGNSIVNGVISMTMNARFADNDGSEQHSLVMAAVVGLIPVGNDWTLTTFNGEGGLNGQYWVYNAGNTVKDVSQHVSFTVTDAYAGGDVTWYAMSEETAHTASGHPEYAISDPQVTPTGVTTDVDQHLSTTDQIIIGTLGGDDILGGLGNDHIHGGAGNDTIHGGAGNDVIYAGDGNNHIYGDAGNDEIHAGNGNNMIDGGAGDDKIYVGNGDNTIYGGAGNDEVFVGSGHNTIHGGAGDDILHAGTGADTFVYESITDGHDQILGFDASQDKIDLNALFTSLGANPVNYSVEDASGGAGDKYTIKLTDAHDANNVVQIDVTNAHSTSYQDFMDAINAPKNPDTHQGA